MIKSQRKILKEYIKLNKNRICELLGIKYPILQGGMVWVVDANLAAAVGNMLGLKPVLSFVDGALVKDGMTKSMKKAFYEKIDNNYESCPIEKYDYTIISFDGDINVVNMLSEYISKKANGYIPIKGIIPINISAHCGPGTIGILVTPKINGKSLHEYE